MLEGSGFFEQVAGPGDDLDALRRGNQLRRLLIELKHLLIQFAHDQERRCPHVRERRAGQVRPPTAGHHRPHGAVSCGGANRNSVVRRSSSSVSKSSNSVANPLSCNTSATARLRKLCRELPEPCANTTIALASPGTTRSPASSAPADEMTTGTDTSYSSDPLEPASTSTRRSSGNASRTLFTLPLVVASRSTSSTTRDW